MYWEFIWSFYFLIESDPVPCESSHVQSFDERTFFENVQFLRRRLFLDCDCFSKTVCNFTDENHSKHVLFSRLKGKSLRLIGVLHHNKAYDAARTFGPGIHVRKKAAVIFVEFWFRKTFCYVCICLTFFFFVLSMIISLIPFS